MKLYHYSEDTSIRIFQPRPHPKHPNLPDSVWAIDEEGSPMYLLPRECPRIVYWPIQTTSQEEKDLFKSQTTSRMIITVEQRWFQKIQSATITQYTFESTLFNSFDEGAGYYTSTQTIIPEKVVQINNLLD